MDKASEFKQRYNDLIENIRALNRQPGVSLSRAMRQYIHEWDELVGASGIYSLSKAASDLGLAQKYLATVASRARAAARKASRTTSTEPGPANPATDNPAPARDAGNDKIDKRSVAPKPPTKVVDDEDEARPWYVSSDDPDGVERRESADGTEFERRYIGSKKKLMPRSKEF